MTFKLKLLFCHCVFLSKVSFFPTLQKLLPFIVMRKCPQWTILDMHLALIHVWPVMLMLLSSFW